MPWSVVVGLVLVGLAGGVLIGRWLRGWVARWCATYGGPVCEPTWRMQRQWANEMLALHAPDTTMRTTHVVKGGEHLMRIKDYWSATPLTQPEGDEPDESTPAVPDAEPRD